MYIFNYLIKELFRNLLLKKFYKHKAYYFRIFKKLSIKIIKKIKLKNII